MIDDNNDELIERVARALRPMPPTNARAVAQIVAATRSRAVRAPGRLTLVLEWMREPTFSVASMGLLAAAALAIGFVTDRALSSLNEAAPLESSRAVTSPVAEAANAPFAFREVPVPILLDAAHANKVSIVGDFNDWDSVASPMTRFGSNGPWTATVKVTPGRHLYAFMVDGKFVVDPRAPRTRDLDYGGDASVLMVNTP